MRLSSLINRSLTVGKSIIINISEFSIKYLSWYYFVILEHNVNVSSIIKYHWNCSLFRNEFY